MNKYIGAHIDPYKPVDLTTNSSASSKRKAKSTGGESGGKKRAPGIQAPWRLSEAMIAVVGKPVLPRPQVTQALWAYIRENNLQVRCVGIIKFELDLRLTATCRILPTRGKSCATTSYGR